MRRVILDVQGGTGPLIAFAGVTLRAGGCDTFRNLDWAIRPGECWVVCGPTGAGKSLLLAALAGAVPSSAGEIVYRVGRGSAPRPDFPEGRVGLVSPDQHRALASQALDFLQARWSPREAKDALTVRRLLRRSAPRATTAALQAALARTAMVAMIDRDLATLSNGEFRRVLFARALLRDPRVLLLDDPFAGIDLAGRAQIHAIIAAHATPQRAVVLAVPRAEDVPPGATHLIAVRDLGVTYLGPYRAAQFRRATRVPRAKAGGVSASRVGALAFCPASTPADTPLVDLRAVRVRYGNVVALHPLSWCLRPGEKWVLRGPNGAGKTTLSNLLLGDHPQAYANEIYLFGRRRGSGESIWDIKARIGWMAPELQYTFPAGPSALAVVCSGLHEVLGLAFSPSRAQRSRALGLLRYFGAEPLARRAFGELSDGEQRLVLLARALVKRPPLLILDEPSQGLDPAHRRILHRAITALARIPRLGILLITHLEEDIPGNFTHAMYLERGRALQLGPR